MEEFSLIERFFKQPASGCLSGNKTIVNGIGDDCAVLAPGPNTQLVLSIDTLVEGVHFPSGAPAFDVGTRALCTALSDLAAMGATPLWFTLALTLPKALAESELWLRQFSDGVFSVANAYNCSLIGGDTTRGALCISVQVHGSVPVGAAVLRSGANPGDEVFVSNHLGDGAAALAYLLNTWPSGAQELAPAGQAYLQQRFYKPQPQIELGLQLQSVATAMLDVSDGLLADLQHICEASNVSAEVEASSLPISDIWRPYVSASQALTWALNGGDDYQLCFTVAPDKRSALYAMQLPVHCIGRIVAKEHHQKHVESSGVTVLSNNTPLNITSCGFNHFD